MRLVQVLLCSATLALGATGPQFPQGVDLIQRIDQTYSWLSLASFAVDAVGNIYLAGTASTIPSAVNIRQGPLGGGDIVVIKLDPTGQQILYGTAIGGSQSDGVQAIKVDAAGNAYLVVLPGSLDFPIGFSQPGSSHTYPRGIVSLNSAGSLVYSTAFYWAISIDDFDIAADGSVFFGGVAVNGELPVSPSAFLPSPNGESLIPGYVAKLSSNGLSVDAATYVSGKVSHLLCQAGGDVLFSVVNGIAALNSSLSRRLFSIGTNIEPFPTNDAGSIEIGLDTFGNIYAAGPTAIRKYSPDGQQLLYSRDFTDASVLQFAVTPAGKVYLFGFVASNFPTRNATQPCAPDLPTSISGVSEGGGFLMAIGAEGETVYGTYIAEKVNFFGASAGAADRLYALAEATLAQDGARWRGIVTLNSGEIPADHTSAACLTQAGTLQRGPIAPGTIVALFGSGLGPKDGVSFVLKDGHAPFDLAGTTVTVDGKPAPILYAQNSQINFVVPWSIRTDGSTVPVCAAFGGDTSCLNPTTFSFDVGFFNVSNVIAAINQDGTINAQDHPAPLGSYVSLYLTGSGPLQGSSEDGAIAGLPLQKLAASVTAAIWPSPACVFGGMLCPSAQTTTVIYAGSAPTLVNGASVVILRIPNTLLTGNRWVIVAFQLAGKGSSAAGGLWIGP